MQLDMGVSPINYTTSIRFYSSIIIDYNNKSQVIRCCYKRNENQLENPQLKEIYTTYYYIFWPLTVSKNVV